MLFSLEERVCVVVCVWLCLCVCERERQRICFLLSFTLDGNSNICVVKVRSVDFQNALYMYIFLLGVFV